MTTPIADTMAVLAELKEEGKIRPIGACNANLMQLAEYGPIDSDQEKFSLLDREIEQNGSWPIAAGRASACCPIRRWPTAC